MSDYENTLREKVRTLEAQLHTANIELAAVKKVKDDALNKRDYFQRECAKKGVIYDEARAELRRLRDAIKKVLDMRKNTAGPVVWAKAEAILCAALKKPEEP